MNLLTKTALAAALVLGTSAPALAHHSSAMFDYTKERELKGVVTQFGFTNPHGYLQLAVTTSSGRVQNWTVEFQSVSAMARQGLKANSFKPGDNVSVVIHQLRNGTTGGDFIRGVLADGKSVSFERQN